MPDTRRRAVTDGAGTEADRFRYSLTPAGAGVVTLVVPGVLVSMAAQHRPLVAVGLGAALILVINMASARRSMARPRLTASGPTTATVGSEYALRLQNESDRSLRCLIGVADAVRRWIPATLPVTGEVGVRATRRGVVADIRVDLQTAIPFGLVACTRTTTVKLLSPVHVEPRRVPVSLPAMSVIDPLTHVYRGAEPIGLRPYIVGDSPRDVHWPSVARTGTMVVRDRRRTGSETELDVVIQTLDAGCDLPLMLGQARSALEQLLADGYHIRLVTTEGAPNDDVVAGGPQTRYVVGLLSSLDELGVRLSRVAVGQPGPIDGLIGSSARLVIAAEGFQWQSQP